MKFVYKLITVCLLFVASSSAMDMKKISIVSKMNPQLFNKDNSFITTSGKFNKSYIKEFHTSNSLVSLEKNTKIKSFDIKKNSKFTSILAKKYMNDKSHITQDEDGNYYFDGEKIKIMQNGAWGAAIGVNVGWFVTNVVGHGLIIAGCRVADVIVPGSGAYAQPGLHVAAAPYILAASKVVAVGTGIVVATITGPI